LSVYELFSENDDAFYETCLSNKENRNQLLKPIFIADVFSLKT